MIGGLAIITIAVTTLLVKFLPRTARYRHDIISLVLPSQSFFFSVLNGASLQGARLCRSSKVFIMSSQIMPCNTGLELESESSVGYYDQSVTMGADYCADRACGCRS